MGLPSRNVFRQFRFSGYPSVECGVDGLVVKDGAEGATLVYRCYLHEGYKGYLTIEDFEDALPGIVDGMKEPG